MNHSNNPLVILKKAMPFLKEEGRAFFCFWLFSAGIGLSLFHYRQGLNAESAQKIQIIQELLLVFLNVIFLHFLNLKRQKLEKGLSALFFESCILVFGFVLQTLFWILATLLGVVLLVVPGIWVGTTFFFAPILAVIYPDYEGKVFLLSKELFAPNFINTLVHVLFYGVVMTGVLPLIHYLIAGNLESQLSYFFSPVNAGLFLLSQACLFEYVFTFVDEHRRQRISSKK